METLHARSLCPDRAAPNGKLLASPHPGIHELPEGPVVVIADLGWGDLVGRDVIP
jgi:hypothetical protein